MTTTQTKLGRFERTTKFLESLHHRIDSDNGAKAVLKRALSGEPKHIRAIYPMVLPSLESISEWQQDVWILVACLSVYYPQDMRKEQKNFGHSCRELANTTQSKGANRRFRSLLDTSLSDVRSPLTALVRQIKSKEIRIDYPLLIVDLCQWEYPDQYIQDQWARTFWGASSNQLNQSESQAIDLQND